MATNVWEYLATWIPLKIMVDVAIYTSPMEHLGIEINHSWIRKDTIVPWIYYGNYNYGKKKEK